MGWRILIVDDDSAMLRSCQKVLCNDGHAVEITPDPLEGLIFDAPILSATGISDLSLL